MKKLKLIYNPFAGDTTFKDYLDDVIKILQVDGEYEVGVYRVHHYGDIDNYIKIISKQDVDVICVSGGDGSINLVVNAMKKHNLNVPLGVFPSGTANDFASFIGIPKNPVDAAKSIVGNNIKEVDIGYAGDRYFVNVVCAGLFASISQGVDVDLKNTIGKLAYYIKGVKALSNVKPMSATITTIIGKFEVDTYLIFIMNSSSAGGFSQLAPESSISDGMFDLVVFKSDAPIKAASALLKTINGKHIEDKNVIYYKDNYFKIESQDAKDVYPEIDIDGELGPSLPLEIKTLEKGLRIFMPTSYLQ